MNTKQFVLFSLSAVSLLVCACSQTAQKGPSFRQTVTTYAQITANVPAQVWIGQNNVGTTPISYPFTYEEQVDRTVKTANYWETNPGTAAALSVLSFGTYIPFSFIPAEPTSKTEASGKYFNNRFSLRLVADGYEPLEYELVCQGEEKIEVSLSLKINKAD